MLLYNIGGSEMANIIDYIKWRGDITLNQTPINELDNIILARFSYLPFKDIELKSEETIQSIAYKMKDLEQEKYLWEDDKDFLQEIGKSERFKNLIATDYLEIFDESAEKQFAAITISLPNNTKYISYRGTDSSLVGWKEDLNMSFMEHVPSQKEAVNYLNKIAEKYKDNFIIGGHSKGGNLAVYSAIFCENEVKPRILKVINADGPGVDKSVIQTSNYKKVLGKIETFIPQSSIVGRLLEHEEEYQVIKSNQKGFMQHDIYSWQVEQAALIRIPSLTSNSEIFNGIVRDWLKNTTAEERKEFISIIYEIITTTKATTTSDFRIDTAKKIGTMLNSYRNINAANKKEMEQMIKLLFESTIKVLKETRKAKKIQTK